MSFESLWRDVGAWSNATFGDETERGPVGPLKHLVVEVLHELLGIDKVYVEHFLANWKRTVNRPQNGRDLGELADVLILLMDATRRAGYGPDDLLAAVESKHAVNVTRTYPKPTGDEISEHVKGTTS
jgi:hypothetical protein